MRHRRVSSKNGWTDIARGFYFLPHTSLRSLSLSLSLSLSFSLSLSVYLFLSLCTYILALIRKMNFTPITPSRCHCIPKDSRWRVSRTSYIWHPDCVIRFPVVNKYHNSWTLNPLFFWEIKKAYFLPIIKFKLIFICLFKMNFRIHWNKLIYFYIIELVLYYDR